MGRVELKIHRDVFFGVCIIENKSALVYTLMACCGINKPVIVHSNDNKDDSRSNTYPQGGSCQSS